MHPNTLKLSLISLLFLPSIVNAGVHSGHGRVADILLRQSMDNYALFYIENFNTAGSCHIFQDLVAISIEKNSDKQEQIYSMLLAAYMSGSTVDVVIDDTKKDSNDTCFVKDVRLNKNF